MMRNVALKIIVGALLGIAASFVFAKLAWSVYIQADANPLVRRSLEVRSRSVRSDLPRTRRVASAASDAVRETIGVAEKMFLTGVTKDFGSVAQGTQLVHHFPITNIRAVPLTIAYLQPSCGCVTATAAKRILQPGESTTIDVRLDASRFIGPNTETVRVKIVGDGFMSTCKLVVTADSQSAVVFKPGQVDFGTVARGQASTRTIDVEHAGEIEWRVLEVIVDKDSPIAVTLGKPDPRPGRVGYQITVNLGRGAAEGVLKDYIYLKTNEPDAPLVPLLVEATVR